MNEIYNLFTLRYYRNNTNNFDIQPVVVKLCVYLKKPARKAILTNSLNNVNINSETKQPTS